MANVRDFYMRPEEDPRYIKDQIEVYDPLEAVLTQVRMTLLTSKGDVLGEPNFGLDVEGRLFEYSIDLEQFTEEANTQITAFIPESAFRNIRVNANTFEMGQSHRIGAMLNIDVDGSTSGFSVLYD